MFSHGSIKYARILKKAAVRAALVKLAALESYYVDVSSLDSYPQERPLSSAKGGQPPKPTDAPAKADAGKRIFHSIPRSRALADKPLLDRLGLALRSLARQAGFLGTARAIGRHPRIAGALGLGTGVGMGLGSLGGLYSLLGPASGGSVASTAIPPAMSSGIDPRLLLGGGALLGASIGAATGDQRTAIRNALIGMALGGAAGYGAGRVF